MGPRDRLIAEGDGCLSEIELLAVLLSTGGAPGQSASTTASVLLTRFGCLEGLWRAGVREIASVRGMGLARAARVRAALTLARRFRDRRYPVGSAFREAREVWEHYRDRLVGLRKERFYVVLLDRRNRRLGEALVSEGSLTATVVEPREVFEPAIRASAAAVILVHNHPSGDVTPSHQDQLLTERLGQAGRTLGIDVVDHVVVARDGFCSFRERGLALL